MPLFCENRALELQLVNPDPNEDSYTLVEAAELDPRQQAKLEQELSPEYHILPRDDRRETVAQDIVRHFRGRGFVGKAMVVSIDKATTLEMQDTMWKRWALEGGRVERETAEMARYQVGRDVPSRRGGPGTDRPPYKPGKARELPARLAVLRTTYMALTGSQRQRLNGEALDKKFRDKEDPLGWCCHAPGG